MSQTAGRDTVIILEAAGRVVSARATNIYINIYAHVHFILIHTLNTFYSNTVIVG